MDRRMVTVHLGGQQYKVVTSAEETEVQRLAEVVNSKLLEVTPRGKPVVPHAMLLAAMALAHEVELERAKREAVENKARQMLTRLIGRIDEVLDVEAGSSEGAEG
jgi:cell division protein ZapA